MSAMNVFFKAAYILLFLSFNALSAEHTIYGPQEFIRYMGEPVEESIEFSAPEAGKEYVIRVHNGWGGSRRIRAAKISLNGNVVFGPRDFHNGFMDHFEFEGVWGRDKKGSKKDKDKYDSWSIDKLVVFDKSVTLRKLNTLSIVLYGIPQKHSNWLSRAYRYLPSFLRNYLDQGSGLAIEVLGEQDELPVISASVTPSANTFGWHNSSVKIDFECSDAYSAVESCSESIVVDAEGSAQLVQGEVVNNAGISAVTEVEINLDITPPIITYQLSPEVNIGGWSNKDTAITYVCTDALSGIESGTCPVSSIVSDEGSQTISVSASDLAGNVGILNFTVNIDKQAPFVIVNKTPSSNENGWNNSDVSISYKCSDVLSGVNACPSSQLVEVESAEFLVLGVASDLAGNTVETQTLVRLDKTPPVVRSQLSPQPNGNGWFDSEVSVSYICSDTLSGVVTGGIGACPENKKIATQGVAQEILANIHDAAGNKTSVSDVLNIDFTPPQIHFDFPTEGAQLEDSFPIISIHVSDNFALSESSVSLVFIDDAGAGGAECVVFAGIMTCTLQRELVGQVVMTASASDLAGNSHLEMITVEASADSDKDGVPNKYDKCPNTLPGYVVASDGCDSTQRDSDSDGVLDVNDAFPLDPSESFDLDGDGVGDNSDIDIDGDNVENDADEFPRNPSESSDLDKDGIGDNADTDRDGDGILNVSDAFPEDKSESSDLDGDGVGDNSDQDVDGDGVTNDQDLFPLDKNESSDLDGDGIGDNADPDTDGDGVPNESDAYPTNPAKSTLPIVEINSPATLTTFGHSPVLVSGIVDESAVALTVNGVPVGIQGGTFGAAVTIEEGHNTIVARMVDADGVVSTASINVSLDLTPPYVTVESHQDGQTVYSDQITLTGLINDIVRGTIENEQAIVLINDKPAEISNRSYQISGLTLEEGENTITIIGSDQVGNTTTKTITLIYKKLTGKKIELESGDQQIASIHSILDEPLVVKVLDDAGLPVVGKNVIFRVNQGSGLVAAGSDLEGRAYLAQTNEEGLAQTIFKLGRRSGVNNQKVKARVVGYEDEVIFTASATANIGNKLSINSGNNQRGGLFQPLPAPFVVAVTDEGANTVKGARVKFEVMAGGGLFQNKSNEYEAITDSDGRASAHLMLGGLEGLDKQLVRATLIDAPVVEGADGEENTQLIRAGFTASGLRAGDPSQTSISGVVLDNQDSPLPGVTVRVDGTTRQAIVDEDGRFTITEAPVGPVHLIVDGSTTTVEGEYPALSYNIVTVSGAKNPLAAPIYMVKLNTDNAVWAGKEDVELTLPEVPGFKLEIPAGSVTFPDGSREGLVSVTIVNSSKVPMAPPNGMQPQFIVTIQPTGAMFDAPARLTLPNVDAHKPGAQVEMFSYDHDLEEFVSIGLGTVVEGGSTIRSNPGVGVIKAGWHCGASPGGSGTPNNCGDCAECDGTSCQPIPNKVNPNQSAGNCQKELCSGSEEDNGDVPDNDVDGDCKKPACVGGSPTQEDDDSDTPEDNPSDCVDPICVGPPAPDDGETPEEDCMECKGGSSKKVEGHVQKREQEPDDCLVLYCDGKHDPAPNEPLPQSKQTANDCKEKKCDGTELPANDPKEDTDLSDCQKPVCNGISHDVVADAGQTADDTDMFDCKKPSCDGMTPGYEPAFGQHKPEEITDACNKTSYECAGSGYHLNFYNKAVVEKITGDPLSGDKVCKYCDEGELKELTSKFPERSTTITRELPPGISNKVNRLASTMGVPSGLKSSYGLKGTEKSCCSEATGLKEDGVNSASIVVSVTAKKIDLLLWPKGIPRLKFKASGNIFGQYYEVLGEAEVGIFLVGKIGFDGSLGIESNQCDSSKGSCINASIGVSGDLGLQARGGVITCVILDGYIDLQECFDGRIGVEGKGGFAGQVTYKECAGGLDGDLCSKGVTARAFYFVQVKHNGTTYTLDGGIGMPQGPWLKTCD